MDISGRLKELEAEFTDFTRQERELMNKAAEIRGKRLQVQGAYQELQRQQDTPSDTIVTE